jgi:hypothetical protein
MGKRIEGQREETMSCPRFVFCDRVGENQTCCYWNWPNPSCESGALL